MTGKSINVNVRSRKWLMTRGLDDLEELATTDNAAVVMKAAWKDLLQLTTNSGDTVLLTLTE